MFDHDEDRRRGAGLRLEAPLATEPAESPSAATPFAEWFENYKLTCECCRRQDEPLAAEEIDEDARYRRQFRFALENVELKRENEELRGARNTMAGEIGRLLTENQGLKEKIKALCESLARERQAALARYMLPLPPSPPPAGAIGATGPCGPGPNSPRYDLYARPPAIGPHPTLKSEPAVMNEGRIARMGPTRGFWPIFEPDPRVAKMIGAAGSSVSFVNLGEGKASG